METTSDFILERVASIFNKKGYRATSLSEITKATNLTKGAVYFYFKNKEDLAFKSFHLNVDKIIKPLRNKYLSKSSSIEQLYSITQYYREEYYDVSKEMGGCPLLNLGVDAQFNNGVLFEEAKKVSKKLVKDIHEVIERGIKKGEIKSNIDITSISMTIQAMIEGAIFRAIMHSERSYLIHVTNHIDNTIIREIKN